MATLPDTEQQEDIQPQTTATTNEVKHAPSTATMATTAATEVATIKQPSMRTVATKPAPLEMMDTMTKGVIDLDLGDAPCEAVCNAVQFASNTVPTAVMAVARFVMDHLLNNSSQVPFRSVFQDGMTMAVPWTDKAYE